jgi:GH43 family beta-xylosidase
MDRDMNWFFLRFKFPILAAVVVISIACREDEGNPPNPPAVDTQFSNPLLTSAPDPWVEQHGEWYYFTHTTGNNIRLYRTNAMSALPQAEAKTIWSPPATGMNSKNIWAPEIQYIGGKWYFYYAADDGENRNHRMWVLENDSPDPFTGSWTDVGKLSLPEDKWAIDGSAFEHGGELYFVWSGWQGDINVQQDIYIVKMSDPLTPDGPATILSSPTLEWEKAGDTPLINEAPQFLAKDDKVFIVYSASGCWTDDYTLGILTADADSDLLNPISWTKSATPVFVKNPDGQAFGPGHNSFFTSPDGTENWILYHANPSAGQGCGNKRSTRMQKFTWNEDGTPNFGVPVPLGEKLDKPSGDD